MLYIMKVRNLKEAGLYRPANNTLTIKSNSAFSDGEIFPYMYIVQLDKSQISKKTQPRPIMCFLEKRISTHKNDGTYNQYWFLIDGSPTILRHRSIALLEELNGKD